MRKAEYDFLNWTSFPSSVKLASDEVEPAFLGHFTPDNFPVTPGKTLKFTFKAKQENVIPPFQSSLAAIAGWNGKEWTWRDLYTPLSRGTFDWREISSPSGIIPSNITRIRIGLQGGGGTPIGVTWYDDLKIFQDGVLIYSNDFSNWSPVIGAGVGAPIGGVAGYLLKEPLGPMVSEVVGAVVGGALGGGVGLLTGLGIIPVPQIPALEAPEGPGAPAWLGKYLITG